MHLADAFIQSDLHCIQVTVLHFYQLLLSLGIEPMILALLVPCSTIWATGKLKHKNTIICLQTFRKHAKLTYLFIWKTMLQSVILLWICAVRPGMSVFVMVCETRPLPVYPIVFRHPGLPVEGKHSIFNLIHRHVRSFLLVSLIWHPACASSLRRRGWWKKTSPIFWIWTAIPSSTARYSTFKIIHVASVVQPGRCNMAAHCFGCVFT